MWKPVIYGIYILVLPILAQAQMPSPNERLKPVVDDSIELDLINGVGSVRVYFRKAKDVPLPDPPRVADITGDSGGAVSTLKTTWVDPKPDKDKAGLALLEIVTDRPIPPINAKAVLIFSWEDGDWPLPFTLKTQQPPIPPVSATARLDRVSSDAIQLLLVNGQGTIRIYFYKAAGYPMPTISITDARDGNTTIPAHHLTARWVETASELHKRGQATLEFATAQGVSVPPVADAKGLLIFRWDDSESSVPFSIKSQQPPVPARERLLSASSEAVQLPVLDDKGSVQLYFTKVAGYPMPQLVVTDAREADIVIPSDQLKAEWDGVAPATPERASVKLTLAIAPGAKIPTVSKAAGNMIFRWHDEEWLLPFSVVNRTPRTFNLKTESYTVRYEHGKIPQVLLRIENTGPVPLTSVRVEGGELEDSSSGRKLRLPPLHWPSTSASDTAAQKDHAEQKDTIAQNQIVAIPFSLPEPSFAGTYQGSLYVSANGSAPKMASITLQSRGPNNVWIPPLILFLATLAVGYGVSRLLSRWFDLGGAQRADALILLHQSRQDLRQCRDYLSTHVPATTMPLTFADLDLTLADLDTVLRNSALAELADLTAARDRFVQQASLRRRLLARVQWVVQNRSDQLANAASQFDAVPLTEPQYNTMLRGIIATLPAPPAAPRGPMMVATIPDGDDTRAIQSITREKSLMNWLQAFATLIAVFTLAYITTFDKDPVFGRLIDYLQTLLYGLGLSITGSQILTKARSSFSKP